MMSRYDAVVIGAGPAGSMAAHEIARAGFSVVMLEKHQRPGTPLCCAEAVSRYALEKLVSIRPEWISSRIDKIKVVAPNGESFSVSHSGAGFVLNRKIFDFDLAQEAVKAGCALQCETIGVELTAQNDLFTALKFIKPDGSGGEITARIFIAADGVESKIARLAGINNIISSNDADAYFQYRLAGIEIDHAAIEFHLGNQIAPGNYVWVFPKSPGTANVGIGVAISRQKGDEARLLLDEFIQRRFGRAEIVESTCGLVPRYQGEGMFRRQNLLVVGDAARTVDSFSGAGITNGMLSGKYAGLAAVKYLAGSIKNMSEIDQFYPGQFIKEKGEELRLYAKLRRVYSRLDDKDFIVIIRVLDAYFKKNGTSGVNAGKLLAGIIRTRPGLLRLVKYLV